MIRAALLAAALLAAPAIAKADLIETVNADINRTVVYAIPDPNVGTVPGMWAPNYIIGNCKTFASDKLNQLIRWGIKPKTVYRAEKGKLVEVAS